MLDIKIINFDDLTEDEKEDQPDNGCGKEYSTYIRITHGGSTIAIHSDAMEPEDCIFGRDLSWVVGAIKSAYEFGKHDAEPIPTQQKRNEQYMGISNLEVLKLVRLERKKTERGQSNEAKR